VSKVALIRPPMTTVASGRCTSAPEFVESAADIVPLFPVLHGANRASAERFDEVEHLGRVESVTGDGIAIDDDAQIRLADGLLGLHVGGARNARHHARHLVAITPCSRSSIRISIGCAQLIFAIRKARGSAGRTRIPMAC
jgi:hypothetical protein